jgi:lipopolysaccharide/colanic/teichoic acid biosynthesis glycosyltransferase
MRRPERIGSVFLGECSSAIVLRPRHRVGDLRVRRAVDVAAAVIGLALLLPLCLLIATAIVLEGGGGGVVFSQTRVGRGGRRFRILKFRTMRPAALPSVSHAPLCQRRDDRRCTHVGRLLRRSHLDELPQLLNVIAGDMALVGPRPLIPKEDALVAEAWPARRNHLPGITGSWQVLRSEQTSVEELIRLDRAYVDTRSLRRDATVLARTVGCVARCTGR